MENLKNIETKKDNEVNLEIRKVKLFLLKHALIALLITLVVVFIGSILSYYFWDKDEIFSKKTVAIFIGACTLIYVIYIYIKPVFFTFEHPKGIELKQDTALFSMVNDLVKKVNTPNIEKIFLVPDLNASVSSYRTWLNPSKTHYLSLGIQLLSAVSKEELKSIIAHELGHISKDHSDFSNFIYRVYIGLRNYEYEYLLQGGNEESLYSGSYLKFIKKLDEMTYSIKRNNEFQADEIASLMTSNETTASALSRIHLLADWLDNVYWDSIWKSSWKFPTPPKGIILSVCKKIIKSSSNHQTFKFDMSKVVRTKKGDTHPSLKDRVNALGLELVTPNEISKKDLAIFTLGNKLQDILSQCEKQWQKEILYEWQDYHEYMSNCVMRRDLLVKSQADRKLFNGELFEIARLNEIIEPKTIAIKSYMETYRNQPKNTWPLFFAARLMLKIDSSKAENILVKLINKYPYMKYKSSGLLSNYYYNIGNDEKHKYYKELFEQSEKILDIRGKAPKTNILPHGLNNSEVKELTRWIQHFGGIYRAWLFQLKPNAGGMPEYPNLQLIVCTDYDLYDGAGQRLLDGMYLNGSVNLMDEEDEETLVKFVSENHKEALIYNNE